MKLAPECVLITVNFDLIQEIEPEVEMTVSRVGTICETIACVKKKFNIESSHLSTN